MTLRRRVALVVGALFLASSLLFVSHADAEPLVVPPATPAAASPERPQATEWRPRRDVVFGTADFVVTGVAAGATLGAQIVKPSSASHWRGGILFDEDVRDALRLHSLDARYAVRDFSDVGVSLATTWPFLVDALITTWWYRGRADVARNMAFVSAEAFAVGSAVQSIANDVASRERPFGRNCGKDIPVDSVDCDPNVRYRSFFSGHTTLAFVSAGVVCSNHLGLRLLDGPLDVATCIGAFGVAVTTSVFRMMSDMHYATDVGVGALVGSAVGFSVPWLHFRSPSTTPSATRLDLRIAPVAKGLGVVGSF